MNKLFLQFLLLLSVIGISSCVKDKYDAPPFGGQDPNIAVNFSIDSVKARFVGQNYTFTEDKVISAIVVADDKSGSFYKQIVIQDSTAGITVLLDGTSLYTSYPIGRRLFIKLKGLLVVQYKGLYQIAGGVNPDGTFAGIPPSLWDQHILQGSYYHTVVPKVVTFASLNDSYQNELIELDNVEFASADAGKPYADGYNKVSLSRTIKDCNGGSLVAYNSGYSNYANTLTPTGNGKLVCIYSVYNGTGQLLLRDPSDLHLDSVRCGGNVVSGPGIAAVRALYQGSNVTIPSGTVVTGVVISDGTTGNLNTKAMYLEDSLAGINIFFAATHSFQLGDKVSVDLSGQTLTLYASSGLEVTGVPLSACTVIGTGTVTPRNVTCAQIPANLNAWESTLVKISNATLSGGTAGTYSGNVTITDASGSVILYTKSAATFSGTTFPTTPVSVTGYITNFNGTPELQIRNTTDVQ